MKLDIKVSFFCVAIIFVNQVHGQSFLELAKMAGVDLKEIQGAEHLADDESPSSSSSSGSKATGPVGIGSTVKSTPANTIGAEGNGSPSSLTDMHIPPEFASAEAASKPSCGNCGKPGCPECGGKLGIGMTPDFGGQAMASGMEGTEGFAGFGGFGGFGGSLGGQINQEAMGAMREAGFGPSMNGFGGGFGGYGAPAASFLSQASFSPYSGMMSGMGGFGGGFESELSPMMGGGGYATFPLHAPIEPYPMRGGRGGRGRRPPQENQEQDYQDSPHQSRSPQHHYEGPSQEQGGYENQGPSQHSGGSYEEHGPPPPPPGPHHQEYDSASPSSGHSSSTYHHQGPPSSGNSGYDYEQN